MNEEEQQRLMAWWNATEHGTMVVRQLMSLITEFRLHPESSRADGMILFYRAASEISYGYAGMRGCIRRAFSGEYSDFLRENIVRCHSFARRFSVDTQVLLERVVKGVKGENALKIAEQIRGALQENAAALTDIEAKADAFLGKDQHQLLKNKWKQSISLPPS